MKCRADESFPSHNVFARLGSKQQLAKKLISYCEQRTDYQDVAAVCRPIAAKEISSTDDTPDQTTIGFVYLMKSGAYYKLGRSNAAARREYELSLQMPENSPQSIPFAPMIPWELRLTGTNDLKQSARTENGSI